MAAAPTAHSASLKPQFISVGCNRLVNVVDWGSSGLVAYAAGAMVAVFNPQRATIVRTLIAHTKRVNTVRWLPAPTGGATQLVSGGADKYIAQWTISSDGQVCTRDWFFEAHQDSVSALASIRLPSGDLLLASASADCTVAIWRRFGTATWQKPRQPECLALGLAPGSKDVPILAVGGTDPTLRLWVWDPTAQQFSKGYELHGHEDWIRSLAFCTCPNSDVLLASAGQDNYIRLWRLSATATTLQGATAAARSSLRSLIGKGLLIQTAAGATISVTVDSVLSGHEDWVYSVAWRPAERTAADKEPLQRMELLSASMDRTTVLWAPLTETEEQSGEGMWSSKARMGEMGGTTLGFYGAVWSPSGSHILAHGYNGALHLWHRKDYSGIEWEPQLSPSGHFLGVEDVVWDPTQTYFVSTSADQTTRAFAPYKNGTDATNTWHEIARPLIHGFDMSCAAFVRNAPHRLVLGAEEKVLRVFDAPASFVNTLENITGFRASADAVTRALGAAQPPLGLSNKPIVSLDVPSPAATPAPDVPKQSFGGEDGDEADNYDDRPPPIVAQGFSAPPFEEQLLQGTLWPEIQKLYVHGNALYCVASSNSGSLIASACHGTRQHECVIRLTETTSGVWKELAALTAHKTTITQLHFSASDKYLLSVSRDRGVCVWAVNKGNDARLLWKQEEAHERIVWAGEWAPDEQHFATGSRDKHVKVWAKDSNADEWRTVFDTVCAAPVTTASWLPLSSQQLASRGISHLLLVGLENGVLLFIARNAAGAWQAPVAAVAADLGHQADVKRASWRVINGVAEVVTCSADQSVRLWSVAWS